MPRFDDVMVDIESLSTEPDAAIVSIGAVRCNFEEGLMQPDGFYEIADISLRTSGDDRISGDTIKWWMQQSDAARAVFDDARAMPLDLVLDRFRRFIHPDVKMWGNGADFDNVVIANAYRTRHQAVPWHFYNNRCYRTLRNMVPHVKMVRGGTHHNALSDALSQARHACAIHLFIAQEQRELQDFRAALR